MTYVREDSKMSWERFKRMQKSASAVFPQVTPTVDTASVVQALKGSGWAGWFWAVRT